MSLDVNTPRGRESVIAAFDAASIFELNNPDMRYIPFPESTMAAVDGILEHRGIAIALVEMKCRKLTRAKLREWDDEWLVTASKIRKGKMLALEHQIPLVGFLYLVPDELLLTQKIYQPPKGKWCVRIRFKSSETQATINGGIAIRENAFIDMSRAKIFSMEGLLS